MRGSGTLEWQQQPFSLEVDGLGMFAIGLALHLLTGRDMERASGRVKLRTQNFMQLNIAR